MITLWFTIGLLPILITSSSLTELSLISSVCSSCSYYYYYYYYYYYWATIEILIWIHDSNNSNQLNSNILWLDSNEFKINLMKLLLSFELSLLYSKSSISTYCFLLGFTYIFKTYILQRDKFEYSYKGYFVLLPNRCGISQSIPFRVHHPCWHSFLSQIDVGPQSTPFWGSASSLAHRPVSDSDTIYVTAQAH